MKDLYSVKNPTNSKPRRHISLRSATMALLVLFCLVGGITLISGNGLIKGIETDRADDCSTTTGPSVPLETTKLIIEHNATDEDTGIHGGFDGIEWTKLCVFDPRGRQVLEVEPQA